MLYIVFAKKKFCLQVIHFNLSQILSTKVYQEVVKERHTLNQFFQIQKIKY